MTEYERVEAEPVDRGAVVIALLVVGIVVLVVAMGARELRGAWGSDVRVGAASGEVRVEIDLDDLVELEEVEVVEIAEEILADDVYPASPVERSLTWLASVQSADGSWEGSPRLTGLALLTYLTYGETPLSERYGATVQTALKWSAARLMNLPDGSLNEDDTILVYAVAEGYGMTRIPFLRAAAQQGAERLVAHQRSDGGWARDGSDTADLTQTWWSVCALKAAFSSRIDEDCLAPSLDVAADFVLDTQFADDRYVGELRHVGMSVEILQRIGHSRSTQVAAGIAMIADRRYPDLDACYRDNRHLPDHVYMREGMYAMLAESAVAFNCQGSLWRDWSGPMEHNIVRSQGRLGFWQVPRDGRLGNSLADRIEVSCVMTLPIAIVGTRFLPSYPSGSSSCTGCIITKLDSDELIIR